MSNAVLAQQIVETVSRLPDLQSRQVLDFATFILQKNKIDFQNVQQTVMNHIWDNDEDEVWNHA